MDELMLVRRMKAGDRSAFDQIYEKYHIPILRAAYLICGDRQEAEDILQETFITCWLHIGELKKEESFRYWLYRIMTRAARKAAAERRKQVPDENVQQKVDNRCYRDYAQSGAGGMRRGEGDHAQSSAGGMRFGESDHAQSGAGGMRRGAGDHAQSGAGSYMRPVTSDYAQAPSDDYDRLLNRTMMEEALDALDGKFREVIVLYYYGEMSVKEIADTLGVFEGTVKSRLYFGRRKLKSIVQRGTGETAGRGAEAKERTPGLS